jgi:superfamily II DNA or RNA helicase
MDRDFSPGIRVLIRNEEWVIKKVERNSLDNSALYCTGVSPLVKDREATFLADLEDITQVNPAEIKLIPDDSPYFKRSKLFIESQWRQKNPMDAALHIGHRAAMDLMNYQAEPAQIALSLPRQRILIADSVGLGKTLEAGILMSELILRGKGKRILVVTVKSMMTQFQKELWNRFTIPLVRLDSKKIQKVRAELPSNYNPFFYYDKTIISIDTLKRDVEYRTHLEKAYWDIIVIDEAHNVAERGSHKAQRSRLAKLLSGRSDTLIMLSATPHDGRSESFASLMNMLDPTAIADPGNYGKDDIKGLCIRRFKKDIAGQVQGAFQERKVVVEHCSASPEEEAAFDVFSKMTLDMDKDAKHVSGILFKTILEKSMFSSPAACLKTVDTRITKLNKKYPDGNMPDIKKLTDLKSALEKIKSSTFSRYNKLLELLKSSDYKWNINNPSDRIVIFTERIETMRFVAAQLRKDLNGNSDAIIEIHGGMSDDEQQKIVEDFGRTEAPVRILVASDVASEGINLHYLSHRLIHFDIPWSLMVFQQRNGRIDRYGQKNQPDIRYFLIKSENEKIKGDMRIMKILVEKEEQAFKNIGDPALLLGKFNIEEEEQVTAEAIEGSSKPEDFGKTLDKTNPELDPFEQFMADASKGLPQQERPKTIETLYNDMDYLKTAVGLFAGDTSIRMALLQTVEGIEIGILPELKKRLNTILPDEIKPDKDYLRLSPNKAFCMEEMRRSLQNAMSETAWPATQYLWPLHPVFGWINDKASLLYGRNNAPLVGIAGRLAKNEFIFISTGSIPNRKATPVLDEWFGLHFSHGSFVKVLTMSELLHATSYNRTDEPNRNALREEDIKAAEDLLPRVVQEAEKVMAKHHNDYNKRINPQIDKELDKLDELLKRRRNYIAQLELFEKDRSEKEREAEKVFNEFTEWVRDTLEIEEKPYIRIIAVLAGV